MDRHPLPHAAPPAYPPRRGAWALGLLSLGGVAVASAGLAGCGAHRAPVVCPGDMVAPGSGPVPVESPEGPEVDGDMVPVELEYHIGGEMPVPDEVEVPPSEEPDPVLDGDVPVPAPDPDEARIPGGMVPPQEPVGEEPAPEGD
ncbi:MAG: hypothetical protein ABIO70_19760 [Pseudomonadota bacterium]